MDVAAFLAGCGGASGRRDLAQRFSRSTVERAVASGTIERVGRGRFTLPSLSAARKVAVGHHGVLSMRSAAQAHGWGQRLVPDRPDVTFPRTRRVERAARRFLVPHWSDLPAEDVSDGVTTKRRTLVDCMRMLPLEESLPIVESAVRCGDVSLTGLRAIAHSMRGRGRARAMGVAAMAGTRAANPYESVLRAIASTVPGLAVVAQHPIRVGGRDLHPDLADPALMIVIEAESFAWHGDKAALTRDCARYNSFALLGWTVIRFSWTQVIFDPAYVVSVLSEAVRLARAHANVA
ncbi:hypothetical protein [Marmoricola sp. RAF53]|uniref:hypothetical protein n=1 Tax=Marmoricola sp. RAF53 TaxID=3233059 RepID=UPI003F96C9C0